MSVELSSGTGAYQLSASQKSCSSDCHAVNFGRHHLNLLRAHWSAKHGPGSRKAHSPTAPTFSRNIAFTSRSIRGSGPPRVCSRRSGARTATCRSAAMSTRTASAANSGSRIAEAAGKAGGNFLTPEIAHIARRETAYREIGALIDAERLATNLLSSMPLTFNLLAPWGHALERASGYLRELSTGLYRLRARTSSAAGLQSNAMPPPYRNPISPLPCAGGAAPDSSRNL
jgi:hypothetical protein